MDAEFVSLEIKSLVESPNNPRRHFSEEFIAELTESVKAKGVITPLIVRPNGTAGKFEVLAGANRLRAAKAAGLSEVPALVRALDDNAALELMVMDNEQRRQLTAIEEADAYQALMKTGAYPNVDALAAKLGMPPRTLYQRLELRKLVPAARKMVESGELTASHGFLMARLPEVAQAKVLAACKEFEAYDDLDLEPKRRMPSVRELQAIVDNDFVTDLKEAPFSKDDVTLRTDGRVCDGCSFRDGSRCLDPVCFAGKTEAFLSQRRAEIVTKGHKVVDISDTNFQVPKGVLQSGRWVAVEKAKKCEWAVKGLFVHVRRDISRLGKAIDICTDKTCKKHFARSAATSTANNGGHADAHITIAEQIERGNTRVRREHEKTEEFKAVAIPVIVRTAERRKGSLRQAMEYYLEDEYATDKVFERRGWGKPTLNQFAKRVGSMSESELSGFAWEIITEDLYIRGDIMAVAGRLGIRPADVEKAVTAAKSASTSKSKGAASAPSKRLKKKASKRKRA